MGDRRIGVIINGATGPHGHNPAHGQSAGDCRRGRAEAPQRRSADARSAAGRPRCRAAAPSWRPRTATSAGPRTWTRRWPARTRSSWIARRPATVRRACARPSRRASTSISKSRPRPRSTKRWSWRAWPTRAGVKHGVIQDKLFLPGFAKLLFVRNSGFFGRILSIKIDAGSWIFDGTTQECQRPSWNYKKRRGRRARARYDGALALHDRPAGGAGDRRVRADGDGHPERVDEGGQPYTVDVEDTSHALLQAAGRRRRRDHQ